MIFIKYTCDDTLQVEDKFRIDLSKTFFSGDEITDILIKPEATESFISVFSSHKENWFLDWAYKTSGTKTVEIQATDGTITETKTFNIKVLTEEEDNLYSNDSQLFAIESELQRYIPQGKNSFIYAHRIAQSRILSYLDKKRIWNNDGKPLTKDQLNLEDDIQKWSLYETAIIIYSDLNIVVGDKFTEKVNSYRSLRNYERDRSVIRIDKDNSGAIESNEFQDLKTFQMIVR